MKKDEILNALESRLPPQTMHGVLDDFAAGNQFLERTLVALKSFLNDYVELPPKKEVMESFEGIADSLLDMMPITAFTRKFLKGSSAIAAEQMYDMVSALRKCN